MAQTSLDAFGERLSSRLQEVVSHAIQELARGGSSWEADIIEADKPLLSVKPEFCVSGISKKQIKLTKPPVSAGDRANAYDELDGDAGEVSKGRSFQTVSQPGCISTDLAIGHMKTSQASQGMGHRVSTDLEVGTSASSKPEHLIKNFALNRSQSGLTGQVVEGVDLGRKFRDIDLHGIGFVTCEQFFESLGQDLDETALRDFKDAVMTLNRYLGDACLGPPDCICFEAFKNLMLATYNDLENEVGPDHAKTFLAIREHSAKDNLAQHIAGMCNIRKSEMQNDDHGVVTSSVMAVGKEEKRKRFLNRYLEPAVAFVIICNSVTIGVSLDHSPEWNGWNVIETCYTTFFLVEMVIKMRIYGVAEYFIGAEWAWNSFDFLIVLSALGDIGLRVLKHFAEDTVLVNLASLTVIRLIRLVRITRLVRLLRLKMFNELMLMVSGIIGGFRTLMWSMVFLILVVYCFGVLMRQLMDTKHSTYSCKEEVANGKLLDTGFFEEGANCNRGAWVMDKYGKLLFGNIPRSMLTVFACFTDGCSSADGTPLLWHIWDSHGELMVIVYVLAYIFVQFGIFNLILAIFVENTMAKAHQSQQKRTTRKHVDNVYNAKKLQELLVKVCTTEDSSGRLALDRFDSLKGLRKHLKRVNSKLLKNDPGSADDPDKNSHLNFRVDQNSFEEALEQEEVQDMLEDLGVSLSTRDQLFEVLDADGNGYLALSELTEGIMMLRGPADKSDVVATRLMMRCLQRNERRFQNVVLENQRAMMESNQNTMMDNQREMIENQRELLEKINRSLQEGYQQLSMDQNARTGI